MRLNLTSTDIQIILDALENETFHQAVTTRAKIWAQVNKNEKKAEAN